MGFKVEIESSRIKFSASHFLKHPTQCSRLHGHNYYVSVELGSNLNETYFVEDFTELFKVLEDIVKPLDHYILIPSDSQDFEIQETGDSVEINFKNKRYVLPRSDVVYLPLPATTSELLAKYFHGELKKVYPGKKIKVTIEESKTTKAIYEE